MEPLNLDKIRTKEELQKVLKFLEEQGFGYQSDYELHQKKIQSILSKSNTLNINYDDKFKDELTKFKNYEEAEKEANKFFSKFGVDDKIFELLNTFYIVSDDECRTPYSSPDSKNIIEWFEFKTKFNLKDELFGTGELIEFYNLDKNYIKIRYGQYKDWDFKRLYKLIFDEDPNEFGNRAGELYDLGKIQIKFFAKGGANIKGDLKKFKEYFYKLLKNKSKNIIIRYNKKTELITK
jgi:hypothetical protein